MPALATRSASVSGYCVPSATQGHGSLAPLAVKIVPRLKQPCNLAAVQWISSSTSIPKFLFP